MNRYLLAFLIGVLLTLLLELIGDSLGWDSDILLNHILTVKQWFADLLVT